MKIERIVGASTTLQQFADKYNLTLQVGERERPDIPDMRYYATFKDSSTVAGHILSGTHGNGGTPEIAISDYAEEISGKTLLVRDIRIIVPRLAPYVPAAGEL